MKTAMTAVEKRIKDLKDAESAKARAERTAANKATADRLRNQATNDVALEAGRARQDRARAAADQVRESAPIIGTVTRGRVSVTAELDNPEVVVRQTALHSLGIAINRFWRWSEACEGCAKSRALGAPTADPATPEELAAFLADEIRASIKHGSVTITVAPEKRGAPAIEFVRKRGAR
jgi:hypothetical protein